MTKGRLDTLLDGLGIKLVPVHRRRAPAQSHARGTMQEIRGSTATAISSLPCAAFARQATIVMSSGRTRSAPSPTSLCSARIGHCGGPAICWPPSTILRWGPCERMPWRGDLGRCARRFGF